MSERHFDEDVIPLNRFRAALARARSSRRADVILSDPDPAALVATLPLQELYYAIQEVGLDDAEELLQLATSEQLQGCFDLDLWDRDHFDEQAMGHWLAVISEGGLEAIARAVKAIDPEEMALYLKRQLTVYDLELDVPPDEAEGFYFPTPDRFFMLDIFDTGEAGKALARLLENLYRIDIELGRRVVMSAKWELESELEETAYRFRTGRMADLGYADFYEALSIYRPLDPASVHIGEETRSDRQLLERALPALFARAFDELGLFGRALGAISEENELERLQGGLVTLVNKAMAAQQVPPSDQASARATLSDVVALLSLGLEFLAQKDVERAAAALRTVALERLFRLGFSLTLKLRPLAQTLMKEGRVQIGSHLLLDPPLSDALAALLKPHPRFPLVLDEPKAVATRAFSSLAEIAQAAATLQEAAEVAALVFDGLGVSMEEISALLESRGAFRFGTIIRTMAARRLLSGTLRLAPLSLDEVQLFEARLRDGALSAEDRRTVKEALEETIAHAGHPTPLLERWLPRWIDQMAAHLRLPDGLVVTL
jgi:hypothetical protein